MKQLFERVSSYWVRYDKYEIRTDAKGTKCMRNLFKLTVEAVVINNSTH